MNLITLTQYRVHMTPTTFSRSRVHKVKVRQRWPQKSCELDSFRTNKGITKLPQMLTTLGPRTD